MAQPKLHSISPFFVVADVVRSIAFYVDRLGFEVRFSEPAENPFFAILGRDGAQIFIKAERGIQPQPNHARHKHLRWDAYVYVPDPDALAKEFAANKVEFNRPLEDTSDGLRGFEIRDTDGYIFFFGRPRTE